MDYDNVLEDFCGDVSTITAKLESYLKDVDFPSLKAAMETKDAGAIVKAAHKVKKASEKLGLKTMTKYASTLENSKSDKMEAAYETLEKEYSKVEEALTRKDEPEEVKG